MDIPIEIEWECGGHFGFAVNTESIVAIYYASVGIDVIPIQNSALTNTDHSAQNWICLYYWN